MNGKREFGDYQTPRFFARKVCEYLKDKIGIRPSIVIEPTCGVGNFLWESLLLSADRYYGIELNETYCQLCRDTLSDSRIEIINSDFFSFSVSSLAEKNKNILLLGNPPWITNTDLAAADSNKLPQKTNFKKRKGFDAITGYSNFDICEYMILKMIDECRNTNTVVAMLCKTSVARNVYREIVKRRISFSLYKILTFDAAGIFNVNVSACLMILCMTPSPGETALCRESAFEMPDEVSKEYYCSGENLCVYTQDSDSDFDGVSCFEWRQGIKHDCSKVVELTLKNGTLKNGFHEDVSIEQTHLYPLVKSSMIKTPVISSTSKYLIVSQKKVNENTDKIALDSPLTWAYLSRYKDLFDKRKSIIYAKSPHFAMFGIGDYSFAPYKVAVSGFYKNPLFSLLYSTDKPVMLDDTCYFLSFQSWNSAYVAMLLLNDMQVQSFLKRIAFLDSKRPYTKNLLQRLDFLKMLKKITYADLLKNEETFNLTPKISIKMYHDFYSLCNTYQPKRKESVEEPDLFPELMPESILN